MKSILSKLWLSTTSLVIGILVIIWLFQIGFSEHMHIQNIKSTLLEEGKKMATIIESSDDAIVISQDLIDEIDTFTTSVNAKIIIIDIDKNLLYDDNSPFSRTRNIDLLPKPDNKPSKPLSFINEINKQKVFVKQHQYLNGDFIIVGLPIFNANSEFLGTILLNSPLLPIKETVSILIRQLTIISLASLIIGSLMALLLAKQFTKPILQITDTARKIAKGDFEANVQIKDKNEIAVLGDTINDMAIQLGRIEKFRRDFIANISHELKTPISLIRAYSELIMDFSEDTSKETNQHLQIIIDESERLNSMVEDILYLSQMEAGYSKPNIMQIPLLNLISSVIRKLSILASQKDITFHLDIEDKEIEIPADENKMYQVFFNLISNAINYSHHGGKIEIKAASIENVIHIEIIDTGEGIPAEDLPYVWDRFYKVDKSRKRDASGTGLGMSIVKNILEAHDFEYGIQSDINLGTTIWINVKR